MTENHLAHAVATFSELGIATAAVLLADVPKWRDLIKAGQADPIEIESLAVQARRVGGIRYWLNLIADRIPTAGFLYSLPFVAFLLGIIALIGISHVPTRPFNLIETYGFEQEVLDIAYWWIALTSFGISMGAVVVERTNAKLAVEAGVTKGTHLDLNA